MTRATIIIACLALSALSLPLHAGPFWGATADGNATQFIITCGTCPNPITDLGSFSDGGYGSTTAIVHAGIPGLVALDAIAHLVGPNALPSLGVLASGNINLIDPDTYFYAADATATGTQLYTYNGAAPTDYTIQYNIDGSVVGGSVTEIYGGFVVLGGTWNPSDELAPILGSSFDGVNGVPGGLTVHLTGSVTFSVNPGDMFYVKATLFATADARSEGLPATADAVHTLGLTFTQGDTTVLTAAATSEAPEPASVLLIGLGLAVGYCFRIRFSSAMRASSSLRSVL